jgi:hypothetical protein
MSEMRKVQRIPLPQAGTNTGQDWANPFSHKTFTMAGVGYGKKLVVKNGHSA